ncbi:hypothetical protein HYDPIDRAFT_167506 [Hydnomerulius pinastri MD-312]|uniref:Uncharacterized protein n=1 Tax=Hydnomerulius pinastri MD-312 TaxID=994086 RepID=A0A0C9WGE2_9AGAM|nr:hypothetical protein HYDPIDRAFT_167506 [Hydnomerulius pinastri MD-312]
MPTPTPDSSFDDVVMWSPSPPSANDPLLHPPQITLAEGDPLLNPPPISSEMVPVSQPAVAATVAADPLHHPPSILSAPFQWENANPLLHPPPVPSWESPNAPLNAPPIGADEASGLGSGPSGSGMRVERMTQQRMEIHCKFIVIAQFHMSHWPIPDPEICAEYRNLIEENPGIPELPLQYEFDRPLVNVYVSLLRHFHHLAERRYWLLYEIQSLDDSLELMDALSQQ